MKSELERAFDGDMLGIYKSAKKECGYNALVSFSSLRGGGGVKPLPHYSTSLSNKVDRSGSYPFPYP